jgi:hypothetical protein
VLLLPYVLSPLKTPVIVINDQQLNFRSAIINEHVTDARIQVKTVAGFKMITSTIVTHLNISGNYINKFLGVVFEGFRLTRLNAHKKRRHLLVAVALKQRPE